MELDSAELRLIESENASKIMGLRFRENLGFEDGFITADNKQNLLEIVKKIRQCQPDYVICNSIEDRHPDHSRSASLVSKACFLTGLPKVKTDLNGNTQDSGDLNKFYIIFNGILFSQKYSLILRVLWIKKLMLLRLINRSSTILSQMSLKLLFHLNSLSIV